MRFDLAHERIRLARHIAELKQSDCEKYGISLGSYKKWEKSEKITVKAADKLSEMFEKAGVLVSSEWLFSGLGSPPEKLNLPLLPTSLDTIHHELDIFKQINKEKEIITTYPEEYTDRLIDANDLIAGFTSTNANELVGKLSIVLTQDDCIQTGYLKNICFDSMVCSFESEDNVHFKKIARVVWIRKI